MFSIVLEVYHHNINTNRLFKQFLEGKTHAMVLQARNPMLCDELILIIIATCIFWFVSKAPLAGNLMLFKS